MVQAKAKRRGSSVRKFLAGVRRGYLPWMAQNLRNLHSNAVGSALSTMREVRISRHRPRRLERQGPMFEILEPRLLLSALPTPFATINIGSPAMADSAIYVSANNQWQVTGAGAGINGHADHFSYTAENWTGSGSLTADVGTVADTGANAQAGVMIRDTSAASSDFAAVMENPNGTISLEYRNGYGSSVIVSTTSTAINLAWVRLSETQSGNTDSFTGLYSTDGVNWTAINATPIGITFTQSTNLAGLAVASGNPSQSQTVNFNSFSATPANFTDQDIGTPGIAGSSTYDPSTGNWTVNGGGADIYGSGDQFNFASQSFTGNGSITAQATGQTDTNAWAKAGVMFRNTSATDSAFADVVATPGHGVVFQWRSSTGGGSSSTAITGIAAPVWVKLTRVGDKFTGYYSTDGTTWTQIGGSQTVDIAPTALAGLAVTAHNNSAVSTATFSHVAITDPSLPTGWSDADIGSPGLLGGASYDSSTGVWTVNGGGADIWGYGDQFNFASESFTGDGQIIAQVNSQTDTNVSAKAGVMFRNTSDPASAFADVIVTPGAGVEFQWRPLAYSKCFSANVTGVTAPVWVKLMRVGNNFSAFYSSDGTTWTQIGQTQYIAMNTSAMAGLAVTAHNNSALSTATFANVSVAPAAAAPSAVTNLAVAAVNAAQINVSWTDPNTAANETDLLIQRSIDDVNFTTVSMAAQGTTSYTDNALTGATTYYYRVLAENAGNLAAASNTASATTAASSLPAPWNTTAIGTTASSSYTASEGLFTINTQGNIAPDSHSAYYIGASTDSFGYVYQPLGTNGQIVAEAIGHADTGPWGKSGLMIRANGDADAAFAGIFITPGYGVVMLSRSAEGNTATDPGYDDGYSLAGEGTVWLKLTTENGVISGYISTDGTNWSLVGQVSGVALGTAPVVGLAADSGGLGSGSTAWFTHVSVGVITDPTLVPEMPYYLQAEAFSANDGRITWAPMQGATSFNVEESTDSGGTWQLAAGGGTTTDTYLPDNLAADTTYLFRVQAVGANGDSPYSQAVSMTTGTVSSWANYFAEAPGLGPIQSGLETSVSLGSAGGFVYASSWQNAMLTQLSGSVGVPQLGINYTIGDFSAATTGNGTFGASGVLLMPSLTSNNLGVNNNYADLRSDPDQTDEKDWITFSITLTDDTVSSNTLTQAPDSTPNPGNFYLATGGPDFTLSASVQSGGEGYENSPAQVQWNISGSTALPSSGDLADGTSTDITLDTSSNNYTYVLTASAGNDPSLSGTATVDIDVIHGQDIKGSITGENGQTQQQYSSDTGLTITDANVKAIPENQDALMQFQLEDGSVPNTQQALSDLAWVVQRNTQDNPALGTGAPAISWSESNPEQAETLIDMPGSFNIIAYADLSGTGFQSGEQVEVFHLAVIGMEITEVTTTTIPQSNIPAPVVQGNTVGFATAPAGTAAITETAQSITLIGGGPDETIGVDHVYVGWLQNLVTNTVSMQYGASAQGVGTYFSGYSTPILDANPGMTTFGNGLEDFGPNGGYQGATISEASDYDAPAINFDQTHDFGLSVGTLQAEALSGSWGFSDKLTMYSNDFTAFYSSFWDVEWHVNWIASWNGQQWQSLVSVGVSSSGAISGGGSPGITVGPSADELLSGQPTYNT